jgi:hypothetical protein
MMVMLSAFASNLVVAVVAKMALVNCSGVAILVDYSGVAVVVACSAAAA